MGISETIFQHVSLNYDIILYIVVGAISLYYSLNKPDKCPPGPTGLPFFGVALFIGSRPEKTFTKWSKRYGDVIGFNIGRKQMVVLNKYDIMHEAFIKNAASFSHRPDNYIFKDLLFKNGIAASDYTTKFIAERKSTQTVLSKLGLGKSTIENSILDEIDRLMSHFGDSDVKLDEVVKNNIMNCIGNVIGDVVFGERYEYDDPELLNILGAMDAFFKKGSLAYQLTTLIPWSRHIPPVKGSTTAMIHGINTMNEIMETKFLKHEEDFDDTNIRDFIDEHLVEIKENRNFKDENEAKMRVIKMIRDLYGAGMETVHGTMIFTFILLANRPEILKRVHDEIDDVIGVDGIPHFSSRDKLPFCQAVIKEMMRYQTVVPLSVPHCTSDIVDAKLDGYIIPKGTTVLCNIYAIHNDPEYWEEPDKFNPDRHIDSEGKLTTSKYFMPFGIGPRLCIGRRLAEMELFIFFIKIFQRYTVIPTPNGNCERPYVDEKASRTGVVSPPPRSTPVTLKRRHIG